jgi:hypothetical protein
VEHVTDDSHHDSDCARQVHAANAATFAEDYGKIARIAKLDAKLKGEDLLRAVKEWMEDHEQILLVSFHLNNEWTPNTLITSFHHSKYSQCMSWCLCFILVNDFLIAKILDNADTLKLMQAHTEDGIGASSDLSQHIPRGASILWTSRDANIVGSLVSDFQGIKVGQMTHEEALLLLRRPVQGYSQIEAASDAEVELLECLERLPLAVAHAAAFMKQTSVSVNEYLRMFNSEKMQAKLLAWEFRDPNKYRNVSPLSHHVSLKWRHCNPPFSDPI